MDRRPFTLRDAIRGVFRRKFKVALFAVCVIAVVSVATILAPKSYYSESKLFLRLGRENVGFDATTTFGDAPSVSVPLSREEEMNSIVELIKSKPLLAEVVRSVGAKRILKRNRADSDATNSEAPSADATVIGRVTQALKNVGIVDDIDEFEKAVIKLRKKISVKAIRASNVVVIFFESHDAELAQQVVKQLVDLYASEHVRLHRNTRAVDFLKGQARNARDELAQLEQNFEDFKNQTGLLSLVDQRKVLVDRMAALQNNYLETAASADAAESEVERLKEQLKELPETLVVTKTEGVGNEAVDRMREELFRLELRREELLAKHTKDHPSVQQIEQQMINSRKILDKAEKQRVESVIGRNTVFDETMVELMKKEPQLISLRTKAAALESQLASVKTQLEQFNKNETKFVALQRAAAIGDEQYRKYMKNLEQAEIDFSLESQELSNISVAQAATLNPKPIRPKKLINLALGIVAGVIGGCCLAVLLEYFDPSLRTAQDVEESLDLPVVGAIPSLGGADLPNTHQHQAS